MADEQNPAQATAEAAETPDQGQPAAKAPMSGKKKMMIIGIVFAVQIPLVIVIGQFLIKPHLVPDQSEAVASTPDGERGTIMMLDDITVNLRASRGGRYLRVSIALEVENDAVLAEIESRKPEIRDVVITSVSGRRVDQLISVEGKEQLKEELKRRIDAKLQEGSVLKVYFSDFVVSK